VSVPMFPLAPRHKLSLEYINLFSALERAG